MYDKQLSRGRKQADSYLLAEGLIAGKVVATHKVMPARRPSKILLWADDEKVSMKANGSDIMTVIAAIADDNGNIKRLNNYEITFEIEGPGQLIADSKTFTNPAPVRWGTAPVLVRSSTVPGRNQGACIRGMARQTYSGFGRVDYSDLSGGAYFAGR